jgi:hypothetical protein
VKLKPQYDIYLTEAQLDRAQLDLVNARNAETVALIGFYNALGLGGRTPGYQLVDSLTYSSITDDMSSLVRDANRGATKRGLRRYRKVWPRLLRRGRKYRGRIFCACWPKRAGRRAASTTG